MNAQNALRMQRTLLQKGWRNGGGVRPQQRIRRHNSLDFCDHLPLYVDILDDGFDDDLGFVEMAIVARNTQLG
jgi:hypothetical protein